MTITLLWWHIPALVTVVLILVAVFWTRETSGGYGAIGDGLAFMFLFLLALIMSLVVWLVAAVMR